MGKCEMNVPVTESIRAGKGKFNQFDIGLNQTAEQSVANLDATTSEWSLKEEKVPVNPEDPREIYTSIIDGQQLSKRVTDRVSDLFEKRNPNGKAESIRNAESTVIKRETGSVIHNASEDFMRLLVNKEGSEKAIVAKYKARLGVDGVDNVYKGVKALYNQIQAKQKEIDPEGEVTIKVEQVIVDLKEDEGGSIDVLAVYSNNTASMFDYKTINPQEWKLDEDRKLTSEIVYTPKRDEYGLQLGTYKEILKDRYGIKEILQARVVPIRVDYKYNKEKGSIENKVKKIQIGEEQSPFLVQFPVLPEVTRYGNINNYIKVMFTKIDDLNKKKKGKGELERKKLELRAEMISRTISNVLAKNDVTHVGQELESIAKYVNDNVYALNEDGTRVIGETELHELKEELKYYSNIKEEFKAYIVDLQKAGLTDKALEIKTHLTAIQVLAEDGLSDVQGAIIQLGKDSLDQGYIDDFGEVVATKEMSFLDKIFTRLSQLDHPVFKKFKNLLDRANYTTREKVIALNNEVTEKYDNVLKFASDNGMSKNQMMDKLMNYETGNWYSKYTKEFFDKMNEALANKNTKWLSNHFRFRFTEEEVRARIMKERAEHEQVLKSGVLSDKKGSDYDKALASEMKRWDANNNVLKNPEAIANGFIRGKYMEIDSKTSLKYESEEYKYIAQNKPLKDFYDMVIARNEEFREVLDLPYGDIPSNFFPNVRKDFAQKLTDKGFKSAVGEVFDSLTVREEDVDIGHVDSNTGKINREFPVMYVNRLTQDKDGMQSDKSYDVVNSLMLFGKMAYNNQQMKSIEAATLSLKDLLAESTTLHQTSEGTDAKDKYLDKVKKVIGKGGDELSVFNDFVDYHLYGIKYAGKDYVVNIGGKKISGKKLLSEAQSFVAKKALALAVIPGAAAGIQAFVGAKTEASKGVLYTNKQWRKAQGLIASNPKKAVELGDELNIYVEDTTDRMIHKGKSKLRKIFSTRTAFSPFRVPDEAVDTIILHSMLQNWGIDNDGNVRRLENLPEGASPLMNIETGEMNQELTKEQKIQFRKAVMSASVKIKGSMSSDDINNASTSILISSLMMFKNWMPGILAERFGGRRFNDSSDAVEVGRFNAVFQDFNKEKDVAISQWVFSEVIPKLGAISAEIATFGLLSSYSKLKDNKLDLSNLSETQLRKSRERYDVFISENPMYADKVSYEQFVLSNQRSIKGALSDVRAALVMGLAVLLMGMKGGDDEEPLYQRMGWGGRILFKAMNRSSSELSFTMNPQEFINLTKNPLPVMSLLTDTQKLIGNTADELTDLSFGEDSKNDRTPWGYEGTKFLFGFNQIRNVFDMMYEQDKKRGLNKR